MTYTFTFRHPSRVAILSHKVLDGVGVVVVDGVSLLGWVEAVVGGFSMVGAGLPEHLGHQAASPRPGYLHEWRCTHPFFLVCSVVWPSAS